MKNEDQQKSSDFLNPIQQANSYSLCATKEYVMLSFEFIYETWLNDLHYLHVIGNLTGMNGIFMSAR